MRRHVPDSFAAVRNIAFPQSNASLALAKPKRGRILAEGDSWFAYPREYLVFGPDANVIDHLKDDGEFHIDSQASNGDEAVAMVSGTSKLELLDRLTNETYDFLLFSGGGNDIVGAFDFPFFLHQKSSGLSGIKLIKEARFERRLQRVMLAYAELCDLVSEYCQQRGKPTRIVTHTYDAVIPSKHGANFPFASGKSWMHPYLLDAGIVDAAEQRLIGRHMLTRFRDELLKVEAANKSVLSVVDTHGTIGEKEWLNEIHPNSSGFRKVADKIRGRLLSLVKPAAASVEKTATAMATLSAKRVPFYSDRVSPRTMAKLSNQDSAEIVVVLRPQSNVSDKSLLGGVGLALDGSTARAARSFGSAKDIARLSRYFEGAPSSTESLLLSSSPGKAKTTKKSGADETGMRYFPHLGVMWGRASAAGIEALGGEPLVARVCTPPTLSLIRPVTAELAAKPKPTAKATWGLQALGVQALWDMGYRGQGVLVAHLDTGIDGKHPALKKAIAHFMQFDDLGFEMPGVTAWDSDEHGTHTAATIAGRAVGKKPKLVYFGVAPEAMLASGMVIEGGRPIARVLAGMDWAIRVGARVLNMSLGFRGYEDDFEDVMGALRREGVLPVIASGNEGQATSRSPGNYRNALSVGACDKDGDIGWFSSYERLTDSNGKWNVPDIVGPGVDIESALPTKGNPAKPYGFMNGTSMATPHIAGLAALLWSAVPTASGDDIEAAIIASASRGSGNLTQARAGAGLPNAERALAHLRQITGGASATAATLRRRRA